MPSVLLARDMLNTLSVSFSVLRIVSLLCLQTPTAVLVASVGGKINASVSEDDSVFWISGALDGTVEMLTSCDGMLAESPATLMYGDESTRSKHSSRFDPDTAISNRSFLSLVPNMSLANSYAPWRTVLNPTFLIRPLSRRKRT